MTMLEKNSDLEELTTVAEEDDEITVRDVSDTGNQATGESKRIKKSKYIPDATTSVKGKIRKATDAEAEAKEETDKALVPSNITSIINTIVCFEGAVVTNEGNVITN